MSLDHNPQSQFNDDKELYLSFILYWDFISQNGIFMKFLGTNSRKNHKIPID